MSAIGGSIGGSIGPMPRIDGGQAVPEMSSGSGLTTPARPPQREKVRLSWEVTGEMKNIIDELAQEAGTTQAEILRRAIALFRVVKKAEKDGETPALVKSNQIVARLVGT